MIAYLSITSFREKLAALLKVKRGVYASVTQEVCNAFVGVSIEQVRQNRDMILMDDDQMVIKLRLADKKQKLSKSDGYRLIYIAMKFVPVVVFLYIYPKRGPMQQLDIDDKELRRLLEEFLDEMVNGRVVQHDVENLLAYTVTNPDTRHMKNVEDEIISELEDLDTTIARQKQQLSQKDEQLSQKDEQLSKKDEQLSQQADALSQQAEEIRRLKEMLAGADKG